MSSPKPVDRADENSDVEKADNTSRYVVTLSVRDFTPCL